MPAAFERAASSARAYPGGGALSTNTALLRAGWRAEMLARAARNRWRSDRRRVAGASADGPGGGRGLAVGVDAGPRARPPAAGSPAPNFALTTQQNDRLWLTQLRGRAVVLAFGCTGCGACPGLVPGLADVARGLGTRRAAASSSRW